MSDARTRLRDWMARANLTQRAAAELLDVHYTFLSQILNDDRSPSLATAVRFERVTGIPVEAWMPTKVDAERETVPAKGGKRKIGKA